MTSDAIRRLVVVGGGSAGWLAAAMLAAEHPPASGVSVTLVESPEVGPIGVGEGTWPTMRDTLRRIGLPEAELFRRCSAAFKQGSRFDGWREGGLPDAGGSQAGGVQGAADRYHHPFVLPLGYTEAALAPAWLAQHAHTPFADLVSVQPHLCAQGRAPKQASTPEYAAVANYGYHFDATQFGLLLREHAVQQLGVVHRLDHVVAMANHDNGDIASLHTQQHGLIEGDLFIDCTGLASRLLGQHLGVGWVSQQSVLFNDAALALQVPHAEPDTPLATQTIATAQAHGWTWDIALPTRRGVGHVYSTAHASDDAVEAALRAYIRRTGGPAELPAARKLSFRPGFRAQFWHRNCVAIGLAAGFVEPLEASALALVELSAARLAEDLPATRGTMDIVARRFNEVFRYRWERVIDFLKLHYALSRRRDTDYWREHTEAASLPPRLRELLAVWQHRPPSRLDFEQAEELFPSASYQYVLFGMGFRPATGAYRQSPDNAQRADGFFRETAQLTRKMLAALPAHRRLIEDIQRQGLLRV